jgi:hypothetical protein
MHYYTLQILRAFDTIVHDALAVHGQNLLLLSDRAFSAHENPVFDYGHGPRHRTAAAAGWAYVVYAARIFLLAIAKKMHGIT